MKKTFALIFIALALFLNIYPQNKKDDKDKVLQKTETSVTNSVHGRVPRRTSKGVMPPRWGQRDPKCHAAKPTKPRST